MRRLKKPPARVLSMTGKPVKPDEITAADFEQAIRAQETVLLAEGEARKVLGTIRVRIERGARIQSDEYYFDTRLGIVRHTRERKPPESAKPRRREQKMEAGS